MKLTCNFDTLLSCLIPISTVVEDSLSSEDMKNVIFRISSDGTVKLVGINKLITYKKPIPSGEYSVEPAGEEEYNENGLFYMQIKSKELISFLNTFKSMKKTKAESVTFETFRNKVKTTVLERDTDSSIPESELKPHISSWMFDNLPIKPYSFTKINQVFPTEGETVVETNAFSWYATSLLPIMSNAGTNMYSKLTFGADKVVAFNISFTALLDNLLPDIFQGVTLAYRTISFLKDVICCESTVNCNKTDEDICFQSDSFEAFVHYGKDVAEYKVYLDRFDKTHGVVLDRQYFRDVLKRLSLGNDMITFAVLPETGEIEVSNSKFNQTLGVLNIKGMDEIGKISFKILPDTLSKMIIGDDGAFSESMFMYFIPNKGGGFIFNITDDSGQWFSTASVR